MNLLGLKINQCNAIPIKEEHQRISMDVKLGKGLHEVAHVDGVLRSTCVWSKLQLDSPVQLHVKLMNLLAALVVNNIDLTAYCRYEEVLTYLLLSDAIDAVDYLWFIKLEATGMTESTTLLVWDLNRHLRVRLSKDIWALWLRGDKWLFHFIKTRVSEMVAKVIDFDIALFKTHCYISFELTKVDICFYFL